MFWYGLAKIGQYHLLQLRKDQVKIHVLHLVCKFDNGTVYTSIILKEMKVTLLYHHLVLLASGGNNTGFNPILGTSSGMKEYWY
jgi:predicted N-acetyltransferase YhbS